jgi:hypothetical protein
MNTDRYLFRLTQVPGVKGIWRKFPIGSVELRVRYGVWNRPNYAYGVYHSAWLAKQLGLPGISVIEFGVAGGKGLLALEEIAAQVAKTIGIKIEVVGFDSGSGMPAAADYRDLAHVWESGYYQMDHDKLRARLKGAELILGNVTETAPKFLARDKMLPIGFVSFDLDYYSSTMAAFEIFEGASERHLPRVYCYFDDLVWPEFALHNEYVGELCAIKDFNAAHPDRKICPINMFRYMRFHDERWNAQMYALHDFGHPLYTKNVMPKGDLYREIPL